jgi:uncharacterized protein (UPF0335 family)
MQIATDELRQFIERVETLEEAKRGLSEDVRDIYQEAKSRGYDDKAMKAVIKLRKMEADARAQLDDSIVVYRDALGIG